MSLTSPQHNDPDLLLRQVQQLTADLEAAKKELTIEASLDRVRVVATTMHQPEALIEVCKTLLAELYTLGFTQIRNTQIAIADDEKGSYMNYESYPNDKNFTGEVGYSSHPFITALAAKMRANKDAFFHESISGEALQDWRRYIKRFSNQPTPKLDAAQALHYYYYSIGAGGLGFCTYEPLGDQDMHVLRRFRNVFDLAYRRYTDIELAVAQAREAKIEASLERVRATAMAMHRPEDMLSICRVIFQQLDLLGVKNIRNIQTVILNDLKKNYTNYEYFNLYDKDIIVDVGYHDHPIVTDFVTRIQTGEDSFFFSKIEGETLTEWREYLTAGQEKNDPRLAVASSLYYYFYSIGPGALGVSTYDTPMTDDDVAVLKRFRNVFQLAYRRYTDIEQAFAQAREAQIEAALERVRSKAMAMQKSEDLANTVAVVFEELDKLNSGMLRCGIAILDPEKPRGDIWITVKSEEGNKIHVSGDEPLDIHPLLKGAHEAWLKQVDFSYVLEGEDLFTYYQSLDPTNLQLPILATFHPNEKDQRHYYFNAVFQHGSLFAFVKSVITDEIKLVMKRFASVFDLTYKRFLDLQRAEAQAREAQIELALERVRAMAMAMHNSEDLSSTVNTFFKELKILGITPMRCGVGEMHEETHTSELVFTTADKQGELYELPGTLHHKGHPVIENIYTHWKLQEEYHPVLQGDDINTYYREIKSQMTLPDFPEYKKHYGNYFYFKEGFFFAWAEQEFSEEGLRISRKFTSVLSLTYRRYKDLKEAEGQARESQIEAALERVRARVMAMTNSIELNETSFVFGEQLRKLGIDWQFSYFWLIEEDKDDNTFWITWPDHQTSTTSYSLAEADASFQECLIAWKQQVKIHSTHVPVEDVQVWLDTFERITADAGGVAIDIMRPETFLDGVYYYDAMIKFGSFGMLINRPINAEEQMIQSRFAIEFERAYTRFLDLKQAEQLAAQAELDLIRLKEEKARTEMALTQLKATQTQLIQAEKMASLGELTAGIAHEIQNPLNFVNNFAEVNAELIDELRSELTMGNMQQAIDIGNNLRENEEKIIYHGQRADAIVKGMLQHSRASSGVKESTDINALVDEYVRLAYHGLRAKDKSFNATIKTDFDASIGLLNVVPQDIGRVVLNLVMNAFYAVSSPSLTSGSSAPLPLEGGKQSPPTVTITTRKLLPPSGGKGGEGASGRGIYGIGEPKPSVEIRISDNGPGIPAHILDKIFQPFFTTKPAGQGTGLGLSLSYDIVKAHGGEIKVESREDEGTEFIIQLPFN